MLIYLFQWLGEYYSFFNVFLYLTLRGILGVVTALFIALLAGPIMIRRLSQLKIGQFIREEGPESHQAKAGTPTMGGVLILFSVVVSTLLWADVASKYTWVAILGMTGFGFIGGIDDYYKLKGQRNLGLTSKQKMVGLSVIALFISAMLYFSANDSTEITLYLPVFKEASFNLGWLYIPWTCLVLVGASNAVNLTDGLDGLAIMPVILVAGGLGVFAYASGHSVIAEYLDIPKVAGVGELVVFCAAIFGGGLGFLWYNAYPAEVFMGDVGSLALGAALAVVAVCVRQEIVLAIMGGVFVFEALSVIMQVGWFKASGGQRIFRMAPVHHHFEQKGWPEPRIIVRFWIITVVLVMIGLATLKIR